MKSRPKAGTLFRIDLRNGTNGFGRVLSHAQLACYDFRQPHGTDLDLDRVYSSSVIFVTAVMNSAFKAKNWLRVDFRPLEPHLEVSRRYFIQDKINDSLRIYDSASGQMRTASLEECEGLESAAVWNPKHIEDRLRDYFEGKPNRWVMQLQIKPFE